MSEKLENNRYSADFELETSVENMRIELVWLGSQVDAIHWRYQVNYTAMEIKVANFSRTKTYGFASETVLLVKWKETWKPKRIWCNLKDNMCVLMCRGSTLLFF
jgi:hypothetical protein